MFFVLFSHTGNHQGIGFTHRALPSRASRGLHVRADSLVHAPVDLHKSARLLHPASRRKISPATRDISRHKNHNLIFFDRIHKFALATLAVHTKPGYLMVLNSRLVLEIFKNFVTFTIRVSVDQNRLPVLERRLDDTGGPKFPVFFRRNRHHFIDPAVQRMARDRIAGHAVKFGKIGSNLPHIERPGHP
ncbi:MAG: hypothetical protein BWY49_00129 [Candidatus Omnitrophica bacterium ADurb.Bin314]|nr:MAG: hypothetical protein BWY49_00129 [Candidatus Omnitrophica bacterium ADurb.Bin314]